MTSTTSQQTTLNIHWLTPDHVWQEITQVFASLPYWTGDAVIARWQGEGVDLWLSSEPSGVKIAGTMPDDLWRPWLAALRRKLSALLGYPIGHPEDGYAFYYWNEVNKSFEPEPQAARQPVAQTSVSSSVTSKVAHLSDKPSPAVIHAGRIYELRRPVHRQVFFWTTIIFGLTALLSILMTFGMALEMVDIDTALSRYGLYYDSETSAVYSYEESFDTSHLTTIMDRLSLDTQRLLEEAIADPHRVKLVDLEPALIEVSQASDDYWTEVIANLDQALDYQELTENEVRHLKDDIDLQREWETSAIEAIKATYRSLNDSKRQFSSEEITLIQDNLTTLIDPEGLLFEVPTIGRETAV